MAPEGSTPAERRGGLNTVRVTLDLGFRTVVRLVLGALFVWAAVGKLGDPYSFYTSILAYQMPLPDALQRLAGMTLPWVEMLCGLALLANAWTEAALGVQAVLFGFFIVATGQAWLRGLDIACGCFDLTMIGIADDSAVMHFVDSVRFAFFRNFVLLAGVVYLLAARVKEMKQTPSRPSRAQ